MRASEFILEDDAVSSGNIAVVSMPMGTIQRRNLLSAASDKYPNKVKKVKGNARKRFKNSISN